MREISIEGVVSIPNTQSFDQFHNLFLDFIKAQGYSFGGGLQELDDKGNPIDSKLTIT